MKRFIGLIGVMACLMCFPAGAAVAQSNIPDLKGKWISINYEHHHEKLGFLKGYQPNGIWMVKEQQGRFFTGERSYTRKYINNKKITEGFSGVISRDGKRIYIVDHDRDILLGDVISSDTIELVIMTDGDKNHDARIGLIEIQKVK